MNTYYNKDNNKHDKLLEIKPALGEWKQGFEKNKKNSFCPDFI